MNFTTVTIDSKTIRCVKTPEGPARLNEAGYIVVFDPIAGHFTIHHHLSQWWLDRIPGALGHSSRYRIKAPIAPGSVPTVRVGCRTLAEARRIARAQWEPYLTYQDVTIESIGGKFIEYAGPCR